MRIGPLVTLHIVSTLLFTLLIASAVNTLVVRPLARHLFHKFGVVTNERHAWDTALDGGFVQNPGASGGQAMRNLDNNINDIDLRNVHMTRPEAALFLSHLRPHDVYLEYGTNGLTGAVKRRVRNVTTIEHRADWCSDASDIDNNNNTTDADESICAPVTGAHTWESLAAFVNAPMYNFSRKFDAVLLTGPARAACALKILPQLSPGARVFYADAFRRPRSASRVVRYYTEIARIRARMPPYSYGMLVLVPKPKYTSISIPDADVVRAANEEHSGNPGKREVDWDWVERSATGGINVYELSARVSRASAYVRIWLDVILFGIVALFGRTLYAGFWVVLWPGLNEAMIRSAKVAEDRGINGKQGYNTA